MKIKENNKKTFNWIIKAAAGQKRHILILSFLGMILSLFVIVRAWCYKAIIDKVKPDMTGSDIRSLLLNALLFIGVVIISAVLSQIVNYIRELSVTDMYNGLRLNIMKALMKKDYRILSGYHTGDIQNRIFADASVVSGSAVELFPTFIELSVTLLGSAVFLFFISKPFCIFLVAAGFFMSLFAVFARKILKRLHKEVRSSDGEVRSLFQEQMLGMLMIKVFGADKKALKAIDNKENVYKEKTMKKQLVSCVVNFCYVMGYNALLLLTFFYAVYGIKEGFLTYGALTAMMQLANSIQNSVSGLGAIIPKIYSAEASAERITELLEIKEENEAFSGLKKADRIEFNNISFSYGRNDVLKNINLSVKMGEIVAVQGASGIGKSTLLLLLLGIYSPDNGEIFIYDGDKKEKAGRGTRKLFAYTPQGNGLFSGTILENITFAKSEAAKEDIENALKISCSDEFVNALPEGLNTLIGENGIGLSEGQQQRIAIARAILSDADVLLFDESTSALDEATEERLINNLREINRTAILITHRKSPLSICTSAYVIEEGGIKKVK